MHPPLLPWVRSPRRKHRGGVLAQGGGEGIADVELSGILFNAGGARVFASLGGTPNPWGGSPRPWSGRISPRGGGG